MVIGLFFQHSNILLIENDFLKVDKGLKVQNQIDCKAGTTEDGQNLLSNISTSRVRLLL